MYRLLITVCLLKAASSAPQTNSDVTYVKLQPVIGDTPATGSKELDAEASNVREFGTLGSRSRESRIENLPLTIPGNVTKYTKPSGNEEPNVSIIQSEKLPALNTSEEKDQSERSQVSKSDTLPGYDGSDVSTTDDLSEASPTDDLSSDPADLLDTIPSETIQFDRQSRNYESAETTETAEDVTERYEDELIDRSEIEAPKTKAPPKFIHKAPKLSYFQKPRVFQSYSANHLEIVGKRKFRSTCRCEKIWNCPKLQITVPRCPNEYFLCCF